MVYRQQQTDDIEVRKANFAKSIQLANKACTIDMRDSQSWCKYTMPRYKSTIAHQNIIVFLSFGVDVLGNAHFTNFFVNNEDAE